MNAYPSVIARKRIGSTAKWPGLREEQAGTSDKSNQQEESTVTRTRIWNAREAGERLTPHEQLAYLIIAWNAFKEDRTLKIVKFAGGKLTSKDFPAVK